MHFKCIPTEVRARARASRELTLGDAQPCKFSAAAAATSSSTRSSASLASFITKCTSELRVPLPLLAR